MGELASAGIFGVLLICTTVVTDAVNIEERKATLGETVVLPCIDTAPNRTLFITQWVKDGTIIADSNSSYVQRSAIHFSILKNSSLQIRGLTVSDGGNYFCNITPSTSAEENQTHIKLLIFDLCYPVNCAADLNDIIRCGTTSAIVNIARTVNFACIKKKKKTTRDLTWILDDSVSRSNALASGSGTSMLLEMFHISGLKQSDNRCNKNQKLYMRTDKDHKVTCFVLLYLGAPIKHPECLSQMGNASMQLLLRCIWIGVYPLPTLHWTEESRSLGDHEPVLNVSQTEESLEVTLNRSQLRDGQELRCTGHHPALEPKDYRSCSVTLKAPYPQGDPLVTAFAGKNVTLKCTETESIPPANTTWLKTIRQEKIIPSSKYIISQDGPVFTLTIVNCSKEEDEGVYFCRSENPVSVQELEVFLTIKSSASNVGGVIGTFIAVLIVAAGIVAGVIAYSNRDRICLENKFTRGNEERSDVLNLVDSDEEELFNDPATRITAVANGHATSLVQIHHNSPGDIEDLKSTDSERGEENTPTSEEGQATL
uniref:V-set and immunoglobulin domain containing 10 n=1 Tax=Lepisosteus oculatus TaxID=7918 RepID=W5M6G3_LEPOC